MRVQMRAEISKLHTQLETTMIYVTHDQVEAMTMGDRICVMKDGIIHQVDSPINLYDRPANLFVAGFIGTPPMNFFSGKIQGREGKLYFKEEAFELPLADSWKSEVSPYINREVVFGVRPEDICWEKTGNGDYPRIKAEVEVIEPMGSETYLYLNTGANSFIARVDAHKILKVGDKVELPIFMPKAHLFDKETEELII